MNEPRQVRELECIQCGNPFETDAGPEVPVTTCQQCAHVNAYYDWYEEYDEGDEWDYYPEDAYEEAISNCHFHPESGFCLIAGTEYCDWECPFTDDWDEEG